MMRRARSKQTLIRGAEALRPLLAALLGVSFGAVPASAADPTVRSKRLRIATDSEALEVQISPSKPRFEVGEAITFTVRGNRDFFLYLIGRTASGEQVVILPNEMDRMNKYPAHRTMTVPNPGIAFTSDEAGVEEVLAIASTRYLRPAAVIRRGRDGFDRVSQEETRRFVKALRVVEDDPSAESSALTREIRVQVVPSERAGASESTAVVMVRADRSRFHRGDRGRVLFASTEAGSIRLSIRLDNGTLEPLTDGPVSVEANRVYTRSFVASAPFGQHAIVAEYLPPAGRRKSLRVVAESPGGGASAGGASAHDEYRIEIDR